MKYPKSFYQVFECDSNDMFDYDDRKVLFEHDNLAHAHSFAYEEWKKSGKTKVYTIIQPYDGSCRGGYGFPEEELVVQ
jgi:ATP-dependent RNA circularization protein (DNA/RNA ligase family)